MRHRDQCKTAEGAPPGLQADKNDLGSSIDLAGAEESPTALQTPGTSASPLASARSPVPDVNHTGVISASDVPNFTIPDSDMVNLMNTPQLDFYNPHILGTPSFPFPWTSSLPLSTGLGFEEFDNTQVMPDVVHDDLAPSKNFTNTVTQSSRRS